MICDRTGVGGGKNILQESVNFKGLGGGRRGGRAGSISADAAGMNHPSRSAGGEDGGGIRRLRGTFHYGRHRVCRGAEVKKNTTPQSKVTQKRL